MTTQRVLIIVGGIALVGVSFVSGYMIGGKSQKTSIETNNALSAKDVEHAFGSIQPVEHISSMQENESAEPAVKSLSSLLAGLEQKVAAHPENIDQQLLLAQTYNELGSRDKGIQLLQSLTKKLPSNAEVKITLATVLMKGSEAQELKEAMQLFDEAIKIKPDVASMARMYQGEIKSKLKNISK